MAHGPVTFSRLLSAPGVALLQLNPVGAVR